MPTFFDPIVYKDIDINDPEAKFYLISLPNEAGFKFCATSIDLNSPLFKSDPETSIKDYWPITREQLDDANLDILFPLENNDGELKQNIRTALFKTLADLNQAFNFDPPFDPSMPKKTFGPPKRQSFYQSFIQLFFQAEEVNEEDEENFLANLGMMIARIV